MNRNPVALMHLGSAAMAAALSASTDPEVQVKALREVVIEPPNVNGYPDRASCSEDSPFYPGHEVLRNLGVKINGEVMPGNVQEYCVSERWADIQDGFDKKTKKRKLKRLTDVDVEPFTRPRPSKQIATETDRAMLDAAQAKRERKAAKLRAQANG